MNKVVSFKEKMIDQMTDKILYDYRYEIFMDRDYLKPYIESIYSFLERHHQVYRFRDELIGYFDEALEFDNYKARLNTDKLIDSLVENSPSYSDNVEGKIYVLKEGKKNGRGKSNN